jgi:hypothetical protein
MYQVYRFNLSIETDISVLLALKLCIFRKGVMMIVLMINLKILSCLVCGGEYEVHCLLGSYTM